MDFSQSLMIPIVVVGILSAIYLVLLSNTQKKKKNGFYSLPDWNFFLKKKWAYYAIKNWKKSQANDYVPIVASTEDPINLNNDICDSQTFFGTNREGYSLLISFTRKFHRISDVILILTLPDGTSFNLPNQNDTMFLDGSSTSWRAGGLSLVLLQPFSRWRILFNGILRKRNHVASEDNSDLQHVRFNFIWIAASDPMKTPYDISTNLLAEAVATEPWKNPQWLHGVTHSSKRGYDQCGSLVGFITLNEKEQPLTTSIYGVRQRQWQSEDTSLRRSLSIIGASTDGTVYQLGVESYNNGLTQHKFGNIRFPGTEVEAIESADIDLSTIGEKDSELSKSISIKISTKSKDLTLFISLKKNESQTYCSRKWKKIVIPFQAGINGYQGSGYLQLWSPSKGMMQVDEMIINQLEWVTLDALDTKIPLCATFKEPVAACPEVVGGKGASLALLASVAADEYEVPNGFCLTTRALEYQLKHFMELQNAVQAIQDVSLNYSESRLKNACERATKLFTATPVCDIVKDNIVAHFEDLCDSESNSLGRESKDLYFAVRSSGIGEDSEELSAAGQNATILGCKTVGDVLEGIQKCWSSLFTFQSVEYRRQHGQPAQCGMGVVVQAVVEASSAGVMFTRHPNTGNPTQIFITSNFGLGESVVSGQVDPDTIIIKRDIHDNLMIESVEVGKKGQRVVLDKSGVSGEGGTHILQGDSSEAHTLSISEEQCLLLGRIAILQEKLWGLPRDIEWAVVKDRIYLLQARPITSLNSWSEFELAHEMDSACMSEDDLITFANTGEVLPGSATPLSLTITKHLDDSIAILGHHPKCEYSFNIMGCTHYHLGLNVFNTLLKRNEKNISVRAKISDLAIFGHVVVDDKLHSIALHRNEAQSPAIQLFTIMEMFKFLWESKSAVEKSSVHTNKLNLDLNHLNTALEMNNIISKKLTELYQSSTYHCITSSSSVFTQVIFLSIILEGRQDFTTENYQDIATILSSCTNIVSAEIPAALKQLGRAIQSSGKAEEYSRQKPEAALEWLKDNCPDTFRSLAVFLSKHGHRCLKEFDLATETWDIEPLPLLKILQATVKVPIKKEESSIPKTAEELIAQLVSPMKNMTKRILKFVVPLCRNSVARREQTKSSLISMVHKFRMAYRQLGRQMVKEWMLPDEKLIFFLTAGELATYLKTRNPAFITKAILRRRYFPRWDKLEFPELVWSFPQPLQTEDPNKIVGARTDIKVVGTPVFSGEVVARACVIKTISEIEQLQHGDILITHSTDIGWSPYFPLLTGVVTELGGLISHGAVVAREYGLPCIVGAQDATNVFKTGDTVLLSATLGYIEKIVNPTQQF